jgi:hypothetical protein
MPNSTPIAAELCEADLPRRRDNPRVLAALRRPTPIVAKGHFRRNPLIIQDCSTISTFRVPRLEPPFPRVPGATVVNPIFSSLPLRFLRSLRVKKSAPEPSPNPHNLGSCELRATFKTTPSFRSCGRSAFPFSGFKALAVSFLRDHQNSCLFVFIRGDREPSPQARQSAIIQHYPLFKPPVKTAIPRPWPEAPFLPLGLRRAARKLLSSHPLRLRGFRFFPEFVCICVHSWSPFRTPAEPA